MCVADMSRIGQLDGTIMNLFPPATICNYPYAGGNLRKSFGINGITETKTFLSGRLMPSDGHSAACGNRSDRRGYVCLLRGEDRRCKERPIELMETIPMPCRRWRLVVIQVLLLGLWLGGMPEARAGPKQVVSLNLCTDQLLLALADRGQIAILSRLARDPSVSYMAEPAGGLPQIEGGAEAILLSRPDLVLTGTYGQQDQVALLRRHGSEVLQLGPWSGLAEGREQIRLLARELGHPDRGEALIARIDAALDRAREIMPKKTSILVYERGGWITASRSPLSEVLVHMGFTLHQEALGMNPGGVARLETIVTHPPDVMLVDAASQRAIDIGTALFAHPALAAAVPPERRLAVPGHLTICGGPSTPTMIDALAAEVKAKLR
jgi:iron complex transport system substrate-binding protein